jgi:hypothetical protein
MSFAPPPEPASTSEGPGRLRAFLSGRSGIAFGLMVVGALVAATAFALVGDDGRPAARLPDPRVLPAGTLFGAHTRAATDTPAGAKAAVEALEGHLGRTLDINHNFYPWEEEFPTEVERWDLENGRLPMISWNGKGVPSSEIAAGRHDPLIIDRAERVKELGKPVLIRWFWEMDGRKKAEWAQSPETYIAAWRHIFEIFEDRGATNVSWVWCPNASAFRDGEAQAFYPGDAYVDWVCADGYNWAPGRPGDDWRPFREIFDGFYAWASQQKKPIMVGEFGVQEGASPGEKAAWVADAQRSIKAEFPLIKAVVYFNADKDYDWRMNTSDSAYEAFKQMANDPWFDSGINRRLP